MRRIQFVWLSLLLQSSIGLAGGEFLAESECHRAEMIGSFGFSSYEEAEKMIPLLVLKAKVQAPLEGQKVEERIPADVLKDPAKNGPAYYKDWAGSIFVNPWSLSSRREGAFDGKTFFFVSSDGNLVHGELPNAFPEQGDAKIRNLIRFINPVTKLETFLNLDHEQEIGKTPAEPSRTQHELAITGEMEPLKGKYDEIKIAPEMPENAKYIVQTELALSVSNVASQVKDKEMTAKVARFVLDACEKIKAPTVPLKESLTRLKTEIESREALDKAEKSPGGNGGNH